MIMSHLENLTDFCKTMETVLDPRLVSDLIHIVVTSDDDNNDDASIHVHRDIFHMLLTRFICSHSCQP